MATKIDSATIINIIKYSTLNLILDTHHQKPIHVTQVAAENVSSKPLHQLRYADKRVKGNADSSFHVISSDLELNQRNSQGHSITRKSCGLAITVSAM